MLNPSNHDDLKDKPFEKKKPNSNCFRNRKEGNVCLTRGPTSGSWRLAESSEGYLTEIGNSGLYHKSFCTELQKSVQNRFVSELFRTFTTFPSQGTVNKIGYQYWRGDLSGGGVRRWVMIASEVRLIYFDTWSKMPPRQIPAGQGRLAFGVELGSAAADTAGATVDEDGRDDETGLVAEQQKQQKERTQPVFL